MGTHFWWGIFLSLLGGVLNGSFYAPAKRMPLWRWENTWLIYSLSATLVIPWAFAFGAIPHLLRVYHETSWGVLLMIAIFGLGWGVGSVFFGLGVDMVGLALAYGVILGIIAIVGAGVPVLVTESFAVLDSSGPRPLGRPGLGDPGHGILRHGRRPAGKGSTIWSADPPSRKIPAGIHYLHPCRRFLSDA